MRLSEGYWNTFRETPAEAEIISHKLMLRAGLIHKGGSGLYNYLPMMVRVIQKVERIIREELNKVPCYEILMSVMTPSELWAEVGRLDEMGDLILKAKDRHDRTLCMSPTNEEVATNIFRKTIHSHKQLPITLYQINTKFRDEIRPRFGVMRAREFTMMDAYSFHHDIESLKETYQKIMQAYCNAFDRLGLKYCMVKADPGAMAQNDAQTHEFQVLAQAGEDEIIKCTKCDYAANSEMSITKKYYKHSHNNENSKLDLELVTTPDCATIIDVCNFLKMPEENSLKSIVVIVEDSPILLMILGDDQLNEIKLQKLLNKKEFHWANDHELNKFGFIKGFIGPSNHNIENLRIIFDQSIKQDQYYVIGANKQDHHYLNFKVEESAEFQDLRKSSIHDLCSECNAPVEMLRGIEIGHIFQLGDKYTKGMKTLVVDENGKKLHPFMGCYGIGITRIIAAAIEQSHDDKGIIWPNAMAPYQVYISSIAKNKKCELLDEVREECVYKLEQEGFEVLHDDRHATAGVIFNDADLLGLPIRIIVGDRHWNSSHKLEVTIRKTKETHLVAMEDLCSFVKQNLL